MAVHVLFVPSVNQFALFVEFHTQNYILPKQMFGGNVRKKQKPFSLLEVHQIDCETDISRKKKKKTMYIQLVFKPDSAIQKTSFVPHYNNKNIPGFLWVFAESNQSSQL